MLTTLAPTLPAILIEDGAHHLDLRTPHPDDPESVVAAREQEKKLISGWIQNYKKKDYMVSPLSSPLSMTNSFV